MPLRIIGTRMPKRVKSSETNSSIEISKGLSSYQHCCSGEKEASKSGWKGDFGASGDRPRRPHAFFVALEDCKNQFYNFGWEFLRNSLFNARRYIVGKSAALSRYPSVGCGSQIVPFRLNFISGAIFRHSTILNIGGFSCNKLKRAENCEIARQKYRPLRR